MVEGQHPDGLRIDSGESESTLCIVRLKELLKQSGIEAEEARLALDELRSQVRMETAATGRDGADNAKLQQLVQEVWRMDHEAILHVEVSPHGAEFEQQAKDMSGDYVSASTHGKKSLKKLALTEGGRQVVLRRITYMAGAALQGFEWLEGGTGKTTTKTLLLSPLSP